MRHLLANLCIRLDYFSLPIDVRGVGFSGDKVQHALKQNLGIIERDDTIQVINHMVDTLGRCLQNG